MSVLLEKMSRPAVWSVKALLLDDFACGLGWCASTAQQILPPDTGTFAHAPAGFDSVIFLCAGVLIPFPSHFAGLSTHHIVHLCLVS